MAGAFKSACACIRIRPRAAGPQSAVRVYGLTCNLAQKCRRIIRCQASAQACAVCKRLPCLLGYQLMSAVVHAGSPLSMVMLCRGVICPGLCHDNSLAALPDRHNACVSCRLTVTWALGERPRLVAHPSGFVPEKGSSPLSQHLHSSILSHDLHGGTHASTHLTLPWAHSIDGKDGAL